MHYSLPTAWVDKGRELYIEETRPSDAPATENSSSDARSVWPAVFTCSDPRRLDNNPTCTLAQSETDKNCWAYTSVAECEINGIKDPCSSPGTYGQECIKCKRNTVHCKTWSSTPVEHFWPFHIHELTGEVRVSMFCPQMEAESWLKASAYLHDNSAAGCSGSTQNDKSLLHPNTLFRVPLRIEDRGTGKRIGGTPLDMDCTGKGNLCETQAESPDLWSEAYFDVFISPNNIPPTTSPNPLEILSSNQINFGYPKNSTPAWWRSGLADNDEMPAPSYMASIIEFEEWDQQYSEGSPVQTTWELTIMDEDNHLPITCKLHDIFPKCTSIDETSVKTSDTPGKSKGCTDVPTMFSVKVTEDSTRIIFTLESPGDFENWLINNDNNPDRSVTVVFQLTDSKGRQSPLIGQRFKYKNVNEAPEPTQVPIRIYENHYVHLGDQTDTKINEATRLRLTVFDQDITDAQDSIVYRIDRVFFERDQNTTHPPPERMDLFTLDQNLGTLSLTRTLSFEEVCIQATCIGFRSVIVHVVIIATDALGKDSTELNVHVQIANVNEPPSGEDYRRFISEDSPDGTVFAFVNISDPDGTLSTSSSFTHHRSKG